MDQGATIMSIFSRKRPPAPVGPTPPRVTLPPVRDPEDTGKLGFSMDESIRLDDPRDMMAVRALIHVLQDEPDKARALVRGMSPRDRAVLDFDLGELSRLLDDEDLRYRVEDNKRARRTAEDKTDEDIVQGHLRDL
jgi:hypothetical protein